MNEHHKIRKDTMQQIRTMLGSKCIVCGYSEYQICLDPHHVNKKTKIKNVSEFVSSKKHLAAFAEAEQCVLLCRNCHMLVHANMIDPTPFIEKYIEETKSKLDIPFLKKMANREIIGQ